MKNYIIIKNEKIINICIWDGVTDWTPPDGTTVEEHDEIAKIGDIRVDGVWVSETQAQENETDTTDTIEDTTDTIEEKVQE